MTLVTEVCVNIPSNDTRERMARYIRGSSGTSDGNISRHRNDFENFFSSTCKDWHRQIDKIDR